MEKIKINVLELTYGEIGEPCYPLPLGVNWQGEVELIGRLKRTKGGGADWRAHNIEISLGNNPRIHVAGTARVQTNSCREFYDYDEPFLQVLRLRGYEGRNFLLRVIFSGEVKDLTRRQERAEFLKSVHENMKKPADICQGHLEGWILSWATPELPLIELPPDLVLKGKRTRILNHEFVTEKELYWVAYDYSLLIHCPHRKLYVVSPDHLDEATTLPPGCYYFKHPEPVDDNKD